MHGVISWLLVLLGAQMSIFQLFVSVLDVTYALEFRPYILTYPAALSSVGTNFFPAITDYLDKASKQVKIGQNWPKDARTGQNRPIKPKQNTLSKYKNTIYPVN